MAQITFELDDDKKNELEDITSAMGLNLSSLFSVYAAKVIRDRCIPFDIEAPEGDDPFYSKTNMEHLRRSIAQLNEGRAVEHELIEVD